VSRPSSLTKTAIIVAVFAIAVGVRFFNYQNRIIFGPEQAMSLLISGQMLEKPSLLGQPYFRTTSRGHQLFTAPFFNYSLVPLMLLFKYRPMPITVFFTLLNLLTGLTLYHLTKKVFNFWTALFSSILFLFSSFMVGHSLFIWSLNWLPLLGLLVLFGLYRFYQTRSTQYSLYLGFLSGLILGLEYFYLLTLILVVGILLYYSKSKIKNAFYYLLGSIFAGMPMILFDLKHYFYHTRSVWQYFMDTLANPGQGHITYYHFLHFWPLLAILGGNILTRLWSKKRFLPVVTIIFLYMFLNLDLQPKLPAGVSLADWESAASVIADQRPENFNVASLLDFDTRAHQLRYFLKYYFHLEPEVYDNYNRISALYVLAPEEANLSPVNYELNSFYPYKVQKLSTNESGYSVYKLIK